MQVKRVASSIQRSKHLLIAGVLTFAAHANADDSIASKITECKQAISQKDSSKALAYAEQVLKQEKQSRDALMCKGRAHGMIGQNKEALAALEQAEALSKTEIDHAIALDLIGNIYKADKQYDKAISYYLKSLPWADESHIKRYKTVAYNLIGDVYTVQIKLEEALQSYQKGLEFVSNSDERAESYSHMAAIYSAMGKQDKAVEFQIKTLLMLQTYGDLDHKVDAELELGKYYTLLPDYAKAEKAINNVIATSKEYGSSYWQAKGDLYLAREKVATKSIEEAKTLLTEALKLTQDMESPMLAAEIQAEMDKLNK